MTERLAVLVDGDNVSGAYASRIAAAAREHGAPDVMRVYADAGCKSEWLSAPGFRMIHAGCGKNASDLLLAIDAMELALSNRLDRFVLVSSDGDFSHLALRLREYGYPVLGMGEVKAPASFRSACSSFAELAPIAVVAPSSTSAAPKKLSTNDIDRLIRPLIVRDSTDGTGVPISKLSERMYCEHGIRISRHPEKTWRGYLLARPHLYDLDPRGPKAKVRLRKAELVA